MIKHYYHATSRSNLGPIIEEGLRGLNIEKGVYLCETPEDCCKFMITHLVLDYIILEVNLDDSEVVESFDHNRRFYKCRCFFHRGDISTDKINFNSIIVPVKEVNNESN